MKKAGRRFLTLIVVLASALFASALMFKFSPNSSWLAFVGWTIFFVALQLPWFWITPSAQSSCTAWLPRLGKGD